jgi:FkbM family methyltransferase
MPVALKDCRYGRMMFLPNDNCMGRMLAGYGEFSEEEIELFRRIVRPWDAVVDAGANIGCMTIPLAQMVGVNGLVLSFEPQRGLYYLLCGNLALNGLMHTVQAYNAALGAAGGQIRVPDLDFEAEQNFGGLSIEGRDSGYLVPLLRLDDLQFDRLRLIKADVEGMEADMLLGAQETIAKHRPFLYVENDRPLKTERLLGLMVGMDYRLYEHNPRYLPEGNCLFPEMRSCNVLGVPCETSLDGFGLPQIG